MWLSIGHHWNIARSLWLHNIRRYWKNTRILQYTNRNNRNNRFNKVLLSWSSDKWHIFRNFNDGQRVISTFFPWITEKTNNSIVIVRSYTNIRWNMNKRKFMWENELKNVSHHHIWWHSGYFEYIHTERLTHTRNVRFSMNRTGKTNKRSALRGNMDLQNTGNNN